MINSLLKIPYKLHGNDENGLDCFTMLIFVLEKLTGTLMVDYNELPEYDKNYRVTNPSAFLDEIKKHCEVFEKSFSECSQILQINDILLFDLAGLGIVDHGGIYLGNNKFLHCEQERGVCLHKLSMLSSHFVGYARLRR